MNVIDQIKADEQKRLDEWFVDYRAIVHKLADAKDGKLPAIDRTKLAMLAAELGYPLERVEADVATVQRERQLAAAVATIASSSAAVDQATQALGEFDNETLRIDSVRGRERAELVSRGQRAADAHGNAFGAEIDLRELRASHWRLLNTEDPAIAAKRAHLVQMLYSSVEPAGSYNVLRFEELMRGPRDRNLAAMEFFPVKGQSADELAELLDTARRLVQFAGPGQHYAREGDNMPQPGAFRGVCGDGQRVGVYLLPTGGDDPSIVNGRDLCFTAAAASALQPFVVFPVRAPGQSAAEFEDLRAQVREVWDARREDEELERSEETAARLAKVFP